MSFTVAARGIGNTVTKTKQIKGQSPRPKSCSWCGPSISRVSSNDPGSFRRPAVARIGATLWNWSDEIEIFNPVREQAYGVYMHEIGCDHINPDIPPMEDPAKPEHNGWAYGAHSSSNASPNGMRRRASWASTICSPSALRTKCS